MTDQTMQERLEAAAGDDGLISAEDIRRITGEERVTLDEAMARVQSDGKSLDEQIAEAQRTGDISQSIRLKRYQVREGLADAKARANGGGTR